MKDLLTFLLIFGVPRGPETDQVGAMMGSSWPLKGILKRLNFIMQLDLEYGGGSAHLRELILGG